MISAVEGHRKLHPSLDFSWCLGPAVLGRSCCAAWVVTAETCHLPPIEAETEHVAAVRFDCFEPLTCWRALLHEHSSAKREVAAHWRR